MRNNNSKHWVALLALSLSFNFVACASDDGGGSGTGGTGGAGGTGGVGGGGTGGVGGGGTGGTGGGGTGGTGGGAPGEPTFTAIYNDILAAASVGNCMFSACHGGAPAAGNGGLQMFPTDQAATYAALVNAPSYAMGLCAGKTLVVPGQPEMSLLYQKLSGTQTCGVQMPVVPLGMLLTPAQLEQVRMWIANGAMNDGGMPTAGAGGMGGAGGAAGTMGGMGGEAGGGTGGDAGGGAGGTGGGTFTLTSPSVMEGMELPTEFRCVSLGGETGPSPELMWSNAPAGTMSFAITLTDKSTGFSADYAHWTIFDLPAATTGLPEGVTSGATAMPAPAKQSTNSAFLAPTNGYSGPCGTNTTPNPYEFKIWALDVATLPDVTSSTARDAVLTALNAHDVGTATLTVTSTAP